MSCNCMGKELFQRDDCLCFIHSSYAAKVLLSHVKEERCFGNELIFTLIQQGQWGKLF